MGWPHSVPEYPIVEEIQTSVHHLAEFSQEKTQRRIVKGEEQTMCQWRLQSIPFTATDIPLGQILVPVKSMANLPDSRWTRIWDSILLGDVENELVQVGLAFPQSQEESHFTVSQ